MSYLDNLYQIPRKYEGTDILNENVIKDKFKLLKNKFNAFRNRTPKNNKLKLAAAAIGGAALGALGQKKYIDYKSRDYINNTPLAELERQKEELEDIISYQMQNKNK